MEFDDLPKDRLKAMIFEETIWFTDKKENELEELEQQGSGEPKHSNSL